MKRRRLIPQYPRHICFRLERLRKQKGLSQENVAVCLGISQQTYSEMERGAVQVNIDQFLLLARLYDVSVDYITGASNLISPYPRT